MNRNRSPAIFFDVPVHHLFILLMVVTKVLSQQTLWNPPNPNSMPVQFAPLPLLYQNWQGMSQAVQPNVVRRQTSPGPSSKTLSEIPYLGGKLRLLSTLFGGLRNSGLEMTIAGEIIQRIMKTALRDILIPFATDTFSPLLPS